MKINQVEHIDQFDDNEFIIYFELMDMGKDFENKGKEIDGEDFSSECFGVCSIYNSESKEFEIMSEFDIVNEFGKHVYYIDNSGDKHYLDGKLDKNLLPEMLKLAIEESKAI